MGAIDGGHEREEELSRRTCPELTAASWETQLSTWGGHAGGDGGGGGGDGGGGNGGDGGDGGGGGGGSGGSGAGGGEGDPGGIGGGCHCEHRSACGCSHLMPQFLSLIGLSQNVPPTQG